MMHHSRFSGRPLSVLFNRLGHWSGRIWHLLVRNRIALCIASLVWLIYRSGTQPRRIVYPCQQVAAFNVTALLGGVLPALFLSKKKHCPKAQARVVVLRRQMLVAVLLLAGAFFSIESYQYAVSLVPADAPQVPARTVPVTPAVVSIVKSPTTPVPSGNIESLVQQAVALAGGLDDLISPGDQVVIKVNLVMSGFYPGDGVTSDPRVTRAVVRLCQQAGAGEVIIADGAGGGDGGRNVTRYAFRDAGYDANMDMFDDETGVQLVDLNDTGGTDVKDPNKVTQVYIDDGVIRTTYWVPNLILNCDVLINIPLLKNHYNAGMTCALKNHIGIAPADIYHLSNSVQSKGALVHSVTDGWPRQVSGNYPVPNATTDGNTVNAYSIVDLNLVRKDDFVVVDGLVGCTSGPIAYSPPIPFMGTIMAGSDPVAIDSIACLVMGYDPDYVLHLVWADQRGIGTKDRAYIEVVGDSVPGVRRDFPLNHGYTGITTRADATAPWIDNISLSEGQKVYGEVAVTGWGFGDNRSVNRVEMFIDGEKLAVLPEPGDPCSFDWDTSLVAEGTHEVKLTVYDAAKNESSIVRNVTVEHNVPADLDEDNDVDMADFAALQRCIAGSGQPVPAGCAACDLDGDADIDLYDVARFRLCETAEGVAASLSCLELQVDFLPPDVAYAPVPANAAVEVDEQSDLFWTAGTGAVSHDVYFGTTNPPPFADNQATNIYDPGGLTQGVTYYWRIDEVNGLGTTTGPVWSFTTKMDIANNLSKSNYEFATFTFGSEYYVDRDYLIELMSPALINQFGIKTANDDKSSTAATLFTFDLNVQADVYVIYDRRGSVLPAWMSGYTDSGLNVSVEDDDASPMRAYVKRCNPGTISMGGNKQSPASGAVSNYFVMIVPVN